MALAETSASLEDAGGSAGKRERGRGRRPADGMETDTSADESERSRTPTRRRLENEERDNAIRAAAAEATMLASTRQPVADPAKASG